MNPTDYADKARRWFRRSWSEPSPRLPADRQRMVGAVEQLLRARAHRRARVRLGGGVAILALAVAASLVLLPRLGLWSSGRAPVASLSPPREISAAGDARSAQAVVAAARARALRVLDTGDTRRSSSSTTSRAASPAAGARQGMTLQAGVELVAPPSREIRIGTAEGTSLTIEAGSRLVVADNDLTLQRFALGRGAVRLRVAKLRAGERFLVDTADAEIEVHGTAFRVALAAPDRLCGGGTVTRVSVTEGIVAVRSHGALIRLLPGEEWPADCRVARRASAARHSKARPTAVRAHRGAYVTARGGDSDGDNDGHGDGDGARAEGTPPHVARRSEGPVVVAQSSSVAASSAVAPPVVGPTLAPALTSTPVSVPASTGGHSRLAAQNDLFAAAVRAKGQGRTSEAIRLFADLARQYPDGPLAESALVQRMKLLRLTDRQAATEAAEEYLARFPGGFARGDARALLGPQATP